MQSLPISNPMYDIWYIYHISMNNYLCWSGEITAISKPHVWKSTLPETKISPENSPSHKKFVATNHPFSGANQLRLVVEIPLFPRFFLHPKGGAVGDFWNIASPEASEASITDERYNRRVEEEAISKLERLGYPRNWERNKRTVAFFVVQMGFNLLFVYVLYLCIYIYTLIHSCKLG